MKLVYLLGAGRSGTTLLATVLNTHPRIQTIGEMHQFLDFISENKPCSCGEELGKCSFWSPIINEIVDSKDEIEKQSRFTEACEYHRNIPGLMLSKNANNAYLEIQQKIFRAIISHSEKDVLLDSSKYLARYLLLSRSPDIEISGIYVVRDVRGLITSFAKRVQTSRSPLSTIAYYLLINFFGEILYRTDKRILKIRYEDLIDNPMSQVRRISLHAFDGNVEFSTLPENFDIPHIVGGNRMKVKKQVRILKDDLWKTKMPRWQQLFYYILAFPLMLINNYKP